MPDSHSTAPWHFIKAAVRDHQTIGAVAPTNHGTARRMARLGDLAHARAVAELGPGTGAITHTLLEALPPDARLWAFEIYPPFVQHLQQTVHDARFTVLQRSAAEIDDVRRADVPDGFDAVISSLPFRLFPPETVTEILRAVGRSLRPGGVFVALQYDPTFLGRFLRAEFHEVRCHISLWNLPPALLFTAREGRSRG